MADARVARLDDLELLVLEVYRVREDRVMAKQPEGVVHACIRALLALPLVLAPGAEGRGRVGQERGREELLGEHDLGLVL